MSSRALKNFAGDESETSHKVNIDDNHIINADNVFEGNNQNSNNNDDETDTLLDNEPRDNYKLICIGFAILGMTSLIPWNFFITATDYWMYKFRNTSLPYNPEAPHTTNRTPLQIFFESYLAIAANFPMLISMILNSLYGQRFSPNSRLYSTLFVMLAVFTMTTIFVRIDTDNLQWVFFGITMFFVMLIQLTSAIFQASIFGLVACFPGHHMHALVNGQALAGLLAVTLQILSMLNNTTPTQSGLYYFLSSTIFIAIAIFYLWLMNSSQYSRYFYRKKILDSAQQQRQQQPRAPSTSSSPWSSVGESEAEVANQSMSQADIRAGIAEILRNNWQLSASVIFVFWATLAVFPGICVLILPQHPNVSPISGRFYTPLTTFLLFNVGDLAGRLCSSYLPFPLNRKRELLILTLSRSILPILILFCNVYPKNNTPVLFNNDFAFPVLNTLSAFTNGYIFSSAMVMAAAHSRKDQLELTGFIMTTSLGLALTLGSLSSNVLLRII